MIGAHGVKAPVTAERRAEQAADLMIIRRWRAIAIFIRENGRRD